MNSWIKFRLLYDNSFAPALGGAISVGRLSEANLQKSPFVDKKDAVQKEVAIADNSRSCNMLTHVDILYSTFSTFHSGNGFMLRGCGAERLACSADTLDKSQEAQLPNPRSISLGNPWLAKCTAQLPCLNLVNRMCLSNSDFEVQSAGYNSAQSPTNWESIHGKDPSILCRLSSRLSIALSDESPKGEIQDCLSTQETYNL